MPELRVLKEENNAELEHLISCIEETLSNKFFWLPITAKSKEHFWDDEWTYFLGIFLDEKLIAAGALFLNENEYGESVKLIASRAGRFAEIGRLMVLPEYRNSGYIKKINEALVEHAKAIGIETVIATAHPKNIPSQKALKSLCMQKVGTCIKLGKYERDIFALEL